MVGDTSMKKNKQRHDTEAEGKHLKPSKTVNVTNNINISLSLSDESAVKKFWECVTGGNMNATPILHLVSRDNSSVSEENLTHAQTITEKNVPHSGSISEPPGVVIRKPDESVCFEERALIHSPLKDTCDITVEDVPNKTLTIESLPKKRVSSSAQDLDLISTCNSPQRDSSVPTEQLSLKTKMAEETIPSSVPSGSMELFSSGNAQKGPRLKVKLDSNKSITIPSSSEDDAVEKVSQPDEKEASAPAIPLHQNVTMADERLDEKHVKKEEDGSSYKDPLQKGEEHISLKEKGLDSAVSEEKSFSTDISSPVSDADSGNSCSDIEKGTSKRKQGTDGPCSSFDSEDSGPKRKKSKAKDNQDSDGSRYSEDSDDSASERTMTKATLSQDSDETSSADDSNDSVSTRKSTKCNLKKGSKAQLHDSSSQESEEQSKLIKKESCCDNQKIYQKQDSKQTPRQRLSLKHSKGKHTKSKKSKKEEAGTPIGALCSICKRKPPNCILACQHMYCERCLLGRKKSKKNECPRCQRGFRTWRKCIL